MIGRCCAGAATFAGTYFQLDDAWCEPKPVQRPHPPIGIGGNGEKRTLRLVARVAQHWNSRFDGRRVVRRKDVLPGTAPTSGATPARS